VTKQQLKSVARQTQCPPSLTALKQALKLALNLDLVEIQKSGIISEQIKGVAICAPKKTKTKYPVFSALQQVDRTSVIPSHLRKLVGRLYVQMFSIENVQPGNLDPSIYYVDAYYSRDILIKYFSLFVFERQNIRNLKKSLRWLTRQKILMPPKPSPAVRRKEARSLAVAMIAGPCVGDSIIKPLAILYR